MLLFYIFEFWLGICFFGTAWHVLLSSHQWQYVLLNAKVSTTGWMCMNFLLIMLACAIICFYIISVSIPFWNVFDCLISSVGVSCEVLQWSMYMIDLAYFFIWDLYYGGDSSITSQPQSYTCSYCGKMGFTVILLQEHIRANHGDAMSTEVVSRWCLSDFHWVHIIVDGLDVYSIENPLLDIIALNSIENPNCLCLVIIQLSLWDGWLQHCTIICITLVFL